MDKKKIIYIGSLLILTVIVSITYFSYAFFTNRTEQRGKLNIVAGTLDYRISSNDLTNNTIILQANETKEIEISIKSLNDIQSKYELYYQANNEDVKVGYIIDNTGLPSGVINANAVKKSIIVIKNENSSSATIVFGVKGGFTDNEISLESNQESINEQYVRVAFNSNGGSNLNNNYYLFESTIATLPIPNSSSGKFIGWYLDAELTNKIPDNYVLSSNIMLYAKYEHSLVPIMSSNSNENITITSSPILDNNYMAYYAFDHDLNSCWAENSWTVQTGYLMVEFSEPKVVKKFIITNCISYYQEIYIYAVKEFYFQGSNDNNTWDTLYHGTNYNQGKNEVHEYDISSNTKSYKYYRIKTVSAYDHSNGTDRVQIGELELIGE